MSSSEQLASGHMGPGIPSRKDSQKNSLRTHSSQELVHIGSSGRQRTGHLSRGGEIPPVRGHIFPGRAGTRVGGSPQPDPQMRFPMAPTSCPKVSAVSPLRKERPGIPPYPQEGVSPGVYNEPNFSKRELVLAQLGPHVHSR
ncbi:hypothetical protein SKAU_G00248280 [Synaphobranchus kaupii]|uniref:Uncharacterized protein n=1 Tax=Synaphobranchus kaupii TaxID=118154 RepID=A0A9Q1F2C0_SYNKA|nr:hypothetical protein SKAU_G00248280 [Synaphobranchus kaupii]